jgi:hypothetical protein
MQVAQKLKLPAVNFWFGKAAGGICRILGFVRDYPYETPVENSTSLVSQYVAALNSNNPDKVLKFYHHNAVHIRSGSAVIGKQAIREGLPN